MGEEVSRNKKIEGFTLEKAAESGLFGLVATGTEKVTVQMPLLTFALLNSTSEFSVCSKLVVNPFEKDYARKEDLDLAALQIRSRWLQDHNNTAVMINAQLRPENELKQTIHADNLKNVYGPILGCIAETWERGGEDQEETDSKDERPLTYWKKIKTVP